MTLILTFDAFSRWLQEQPVVRAAIKRPGERDYAYQLRKPARLLNELTITARYKKPEVAGAPLMVHTLEYEAGEWRVTAGGSYRQVKPGIYDLFGTTTIAISALNSFEQGQLLCPYCRTLLFGVDAESCVHVFLRFNENGYWAPAVDMVLFSLSRSLKRELKVEREFKKFLTANPQLDWQRISHRGQSAAEITVFVSAEPTKIINQFPEWANRVFTKEKRPTKEMPRTTLKPRLTNSRIKKI